MALALRYAARSDTGLIRAINEDSGYAGPRLLVIADGVGGHAAGEVASSVAVAAMAALDEDSPGGDLLERLSSAVTGANSHLRDMVNGDPDLKGMGTTLTAVLRAGSRFGLVHVGDSRCYLLRGGQLQQITHDHTFVQTLVDEGRITAEEADHHPQRNPSPTPSTAARTSSWTCRCGRPARATATCSAATGSPAWSARTPCARP
jgi:protein phosphatase